MPDRPDYLLIPPKIPNLQAQYPRPNGNAAPIQAPLANIDALFETVRQLKMAVDSLIGQTGRSTNRAVTFDDLVTLGLVTQQAVTSAQPALGASRVDKLETTVTTITRDITVGDDALQAAIDAEEAARIAADNTLQTNIINEATARVAADTTLQTNITNETTARAAADTTLQTNITNEANARIAADNLKANIASPTFTGDPKAPTPTAGDNDTSVATTAFVTTAVSTATAGGPFAPLASPTFTGDPKAPTPATADNDTSIATTAYVKAQAYLIANQTVVLSGVVTGSGATAITTAFAANPVFTGNVGAGTPSTGLVRLHVFDTTAGATFVEALIQNQGGGTQVASLGFQVSSAAEYTTLGPKGGIGYQRYLGNGRGKFVIYQRAANDTAPYAAGDEVVSIDNAGNVGVGPGLVTPQQKFHVQAPIAGSYLVRYVNSNAAAGDDGVLLCVGPNAADTTSKLIGFFDSSIATLQGSISRNGAAAVAYNTTSDRRLKDNIVPSGSGLETLMRIKVRDFNFLAEPDRTQQGYVAQELYEIYPDAVHVPADPDEPWGIDYGRLTPLIIRAVQELAARL